MMTTVGPVEQWSRQPVLDTRTVGATAFTAALICACRSTPPRAPQHSRPPSLIFVQTKINLVKFAGTVCISKSGLMNCITVYYKMLGLYTTLTKPIFSGVMRGLRNQDECPTGRKVRTPFAGQPASSWCWLTARHSAGYKRRVARRPRKPSDGKCHRDN